MVGFMGVGDMRGNITSESALLRNLRLLKRLKKSDSLGSAEIKLLAFSLSLLCCTEANIVPRHSLVALLVGVRTLFLPVVLLLLGMKERALKVDGSLLGL